MAGGEQEAAHSAAASGLTENTVGGRFTATAIDVARCPVIR